MNFHKVCMEIRVLKLLIVFGGASTTIVLTIYYFTGNVTNYTPPPSLNHSMYPSADQFIIDPAARGNRGLEPGVPVEPEKYNEGELRNRLIREKIKILTGNGGSVANPMDNLAKYAHVNTRNIHIFYSFPVHWFGPELVGGSNNSVTTDIPADALGSKKPKIVFYPLHGLYQPEIAVVQKHLRNIKNVGVDVLIVTWSPSVPQYQLKFLMDAVGKNGLQMAIEIDAYPNRTPVSIFNDLEYFYKEFWFHEGFYKVFVQSKKKPMPMVYIRYVDAIADTEWWKLLAFNGPISVRRSLHDAIFIGHISTKKHISLIRRSNFNGFYNRQPSNGANYVSTWKNWAPMKKSADKHRLLFVPTVGPGYNEDKKQPKVGSLRRHRTNGQYFGVAWRTAVSISAQFVAISSYNDWVAGTQIEEAIPKTGYKDYQPGSPSKYLDLTRHWVEEFIKAQNKISEESNHVAHCQRLFNNTIC